MANIVKLETHIHEDNQLELNQMREALKGASEEASKFKSAMESAAAESADEITRLTAKISELNSELERVENRTGITDLKSQLQLARNELLQFQVTAETSAKEFRAFLETAKLSDVYGVDAENFDEYFKKIKEGSWTASEAITRVKRDFDYLIEDNWNSNGGIFDQDSIRSFVVSLDTIRESVENVKTQINEMMSNGVPSYGGGGGGGLSIQSLTEIFQQIENSALNMSDTAREAYAPVSALVNAMNDYTNVDTTKILGLTQAFQHIATIGSGNYGNRSIDNVIKLVEQLYKITGENPRPLRVDFNGLTSLNNLKVRKESLEHLATYLPKISNDVNIDGLKTLAGINWDNLTSLKIAKGNINSVQLFTEALQKMYETHQKNIETGQSEVNGGIRDESSWIDKLTSSYEEHKNAVDLAIQAEQEKAAVSERVASALKEERRAADETTVSQEKHANALSQIEFGAQYRNIEDLKASLKGSGVEDDFLDKVSESFRDLKGEITSVKTSWEDLDSSGRRTREVIVNAMTEAGDSIQRVVRYVREVNNEGVVSWTPRTSGSATINYSNPAERAKNAAAEQARLEKAAYDDARVAVRQYYDALRMLAKEKDGVRLGSNGYEPVGEQYKNLADTLNRTKTAFDLVTNEENKNNLSKEHQAQLTRLITDENNKYETLLGNLAIKEADAAQAARDRADAEYQKQANIELARIAEEEASGAMDHTATIAQEKYGALAGMYDQTSKSAKESAEAMQMAWSIAERENRETERASRESSQALKEKYDAEMNYTTALTKGEAALRDYSAAENSRNEASRKAYGNIKSATDELRRAKAAYDGTPESVKKLQEATRNYNVTLNESKRVLAETGDNVRSFGDKLKNAVSQFSMWFSMSRIIMSVYREIRKMISTSIELDQTMTQLRIVTKASNDEMQRFGETAAASAKKVGASITDLTSSATTFARLGYSLSESSTLAEYTTMLQNVGNIDVTDAQNAITAIVKAYKDEIDIDDIEDVMNRLVVVGNHFPISVSQLAEGMNNAASTLSAAGNRFDESVALLTSANTVVQNAAKASTGLRTIAARLRNTTAELDELGETMTQAKYDELVKMLTDAKVSLMDVNGEYRSTYDIMKDIATQWDKMTSGEQAALATAVSGTRQQAIFYSIIENFQEAEGAMQQMNESAGELRKAYDEYMKSAEAHIKQFKAAFEELAMTFVKSDFIAEIVDIGRELVELLTKFASLINTLGGLKTILIGVGTALVAMKFAAVKEWLKTTWSGVQAIIKLLPMMKTGIVGNTAAMEAMGVSAKASAAAMTILKTAVIGLIVGGVMLLTNYINKQKEAREEEKKAAEEAIRSSRDSLENNTSRIKSLLDLRNEYLNIINSEDDYAKKTQELNKWKQTLIDTYGFEKDAIDQVNLSRETGLGLMDQEIQKDITSALAEATAAYNDAINTLGKTYDFDARVNVTEGTSQGVADVLSRYFNNVKQINSKGTGNFFEQLFGSTDYWVSTGIKKGDNQIENLKHYLESMEAAINDLEAKKLRGETLTASEATVLDSLSKSIGAVRTKYNEASTAFENYNKLLAEQNLLNMQLNLSEITTVEDLNALKDKMRELYGNNEPVLEQMLILVDQMFPGLSEAANKSGDDLTKLGIDFDSLTESTKKLSDAYKLLETAEKEMEDGGLSADTIKSLAEANKDYLDYLYEENGVVKLNTDAWREYIATKAADSINQLNAERDALLEQRAIILGNIEAMEERWHNGGASQELYNDLQEQKNKLEENTRALIENGVQVGVLQNEYNKVIPAVNAFSEALGNFPSIKDSIENVSSSFETLANLQSTVADGFTLSLEKALEFASVYPEILNSATVAADGQIVLNEAVVNSFISGKEAELRAGIQSQIEQLKANKSVLAGKLAMAQAELQLAQSVGEGEGKISKELAEYKVNAGNAVAEALIQAGIDEATAYQLAAAAMSENFSEFDRIAMQVATDVDGNLNKAAYNAAIGIYKNMNSAKTDVASLARQAHQTALAINAMKDGRQAGTDSVLNGSGGGGNYSGYNMSLTAGTFNGVNYTYTPNTVSLEDFISDLKVDISSYEQAIAQIDGQIAVLEAMLNKPLGNFGSGNGSGSSGSGKSGSGGSGGNSGGSSSKSDADNWFERQYKLHNHLLKMDAEEVEDYLVWLNDAYKRAYKEGLITLDDYYKY